MDEPRKGMRVVPAVMTANGCVDMEMAGCPDCGAAASIHEVPGPYADSRPVFYVGCIEMRGCGRVVSRYPTIERAINAWNRDRAVLSPIARTEIERLVRAAKVWADWREGYGGIMVHSAEGELYDAIRALDSVLGAASTKETK